MRTISNEKAIKYITNAINENSKNIEYVNVNVADITFTMSYDEYDEYDYKIVKTFKVEKQLFWSILEWLYENNYLVQKNIEGIEISDDDSAELYDTCGLSASWYEYDASGDHWQTYFKFSKIVMTGREFIEAGLTNFGDFNISHLGPLESDEENGEVYPEETILINKLADKYKGKTKTYNTFQILKDLMKQWEEDEKSRKACAEHLATIDNKIHYVSPSKTIQVVGAVNRSI